jgi:large subunit ribosomal protein L22
VLVAVAATLAWVTGGTAGIAAAAETGDVYVVQGISGSPVDVQVDGHAVTAGAPARSVVGPLRLPAGRHVVALTTGGTPVATASFTVAPGGSLDLVAHPSADSGRVGRIVAFRNDESAVAPGKARLVVAHIRGRTVPEARTILAFTPRAAAREVEKVLRSAVANAEANHGLVGDRLVISAAYVDEGPIIKRWRARARGRVARIRKPTCHITVKVTQLDGAPAPVVPAAPAPPVEEEAPKPKPRARKPAAPKAEAEEKPKPKRAPRAKKTETEEKPKPKRTTRRKKED